LNSKPKTQNPKLVSAFLAWFTANARDLPWRRTRDPYAIWVSEIMLQQTQVKTVIPFWERWMKELPTIEAAANARSDKLHKLWEGLGYYTRVRNLQKAAQVIVEERGGKFPDSFDDVLALPGIGRYTAGAICSIAFNQPAPILDGNVIRVLTRVFGIAENPKEKLTSAHLWRLAEELVSQAKAQSSQRKNSSPCAFAPLREDNSCSFLNQSLMELGALICTPRNPQCEVCPAKKLCAALRENRVEELPNLGSRETVTARKFVAFVVERNGRFLVRQRPAGIVNAHLWEFPNVEVNGGKGSPGAIYKAEFGIDAAMISPLITVRHSITRYRMTLEVFRLILDETRPAGFQGKAGVWKSPVQMQSLAFASAHKKVLAKLVAARK
jgi:A/G-specific adenine glycosylase